MTPALGNRRILRRTLITLAGLVGFVVGLFLGSLVVLLALIHAAGWDDGDCAGSGGNVCEAAMSGLALGVILFGPLSAFVAVLAARRILGRA